MPIKKTPEEIQHALAKLRTSFLSKLALKLEYFVHTCEQFETGNLCVLPELIREMHQLAGSCGTFQLKELGLLARQVETHALALNCVEKQTDEVIRPLNDVLRLFINRLEQVLTEPTEIPIKQLPLSNHRQDIWLILSSAALRDELSSQLKAFGYQVEVFSTFDSCAKALQTCIPALILSEVEFTEGLLFNQKIIIDTINEKKIWLMLFSNSDCFEIRVDAVRHNVAGYFVSPLDVPGMLQKITRLFDEDTFKDKRVSILDDDLLLAEHYSWVLSSAGIEVQVIRDSRLVISELLSFKPDILLLDMHMPEFSGAEISGVIRQYESLSSLYITFLSAEQDIQQQLQALSFGADDFVTKPISNENLITAVNLRITRNRDIKSLIERDSLTGLVKHGTIKDSVFAEFERMRRSGEHFCVAMIDLDHFKNINDSYGHAIGDVVISTIATLLRKRLRRSDKAGRYGGEEFMIVLPKCSAEDAK